MSKSSGGLLAAIVAGFVAITGVVTYGVNMVSSAKEAKEQYEELAKVYGIKEQSQWLPNGGTKLCTAVCKEKNQQPLQLGYTGGAENTLCSAKLSPEPGSRAGINPSTEVKCLLAAGTETKVASFDCFCSNDPPSKP